MLGQPVTIKRRGIEQIDAQCERALHRCNGGGVVEPGIEITKRRSTEAEYGNVKPGSPQWTTRQCDWQSHVVRPPYAARSAAGVNGRPPNSPKQLHAPLPAGTAP